ncbi:MULTISPECIES: acyl-ACP--UDP-N-acetylglucosamine O-acyltransferase [Rhodopseudomonas]|uniref:Acyl-[acyl-carrier-protein]--UDP-N-acetylglucosamine O-acyltransferase n=1 Tax=Rhodopseudomonas palustris TaxID=1076 RepID=A0A0D7EJL9_RHOPL|nr:MULTISPECIES: acyl-ACP--UDP-N-acetylglucosamine O-acyltransferase [Rhodopseudomonas]KIZ40836.1 UDP-N-acetylglucosamine acyltransferase [Rhodopseudomonas palustris]MDF3809182.1 acyl-ACP--UDP-N-acetylglucosamine O-acyltransferase [Rhodopseudomonas sp. BAL398]WOK19130.1 acyl-ACP--UDP-N-acetylglucosamine O-acyltransferase [Rhodopseudomonas sp. BAL398]
MSKIDPTARVEDGATIGDGTSVGPYCMIGRDVVIGANCKLIGHVHITGHTSIGDGCTIYPFASLGTPPQSLGYKGEPTKLTIGNDCTIRESVTMNLGTASGRGVTRLGDRAFIMTGSHIGHDCIVGNDVIFANTATLAGHCEVGDYTFIGGVTALQQFVRIGPQVMIGGLSGVRDDVIPYALARGAPARLEGLNIVGMRRRKISRERLTLIRAFFDELFHRPGLFADRLQSVQHRGDEDPAIAEILTFISGGKRPLCMAADGAADA